MEAYTANNPTWVIYKGSLIYCSQDLLSRCHPHFTGENAKTSSVKSLPNKREALSSNPSTAKNKKDLDNFTGPLSLGDISQDLN
jgi:hypothetical protein